MPVCLIQKANFLKVPPLLPMVFYADKDLPNIHLQLKSVFCTYLLLYPRLYEINTKTKYLHIRTPLNVTLVVYSHYYSISNCNFKHAIKNIFLITSERDEQVKCLVVSDTPLNDSCCSTTLTLKKPKYSKTHVIAWR